MATAPTRAYTGETTNNADPLEGYRAPADASQDRMPPAFSESNDPAPVPQEAPTPPAPEQRNPTDAPPLRTDPRDAIARRARERREDNNDRVKEEFGESLNGLPAFAPVEGEAQDDEAPAPAAPQRQEQTQDRSQVFTLKVNRNEFQVSHDDLIRYSGLDPADAAHLPQPALVTLAQKNLAADMRLQEVREREQRLRQVAPDAPSHQTEDQRHVDQDHYESQPAFNVEEIGNKIQLGDPGEAVRSVAEIARNEAAKMVADQQASQRIQSVQSQIRNDLDRFASENPDITQDQILADAHRSLLVREAMSELSRIPGVTAEHVAEGLNNPMRAMTLYQAAMADGYAVRPPAEIFKAAADKLRDKMGTPAQRHADPTPDPRTIAKRGLIQQPARNDSGQQVQPTQASRATSPSETIRRMAARTQGQKMSPRFPT